MGSMTSSHSSGIITGPSYLVSRLRTGFPSSLRGVPSSSVTILPSSSLWSLASSAAR